MTTQISQQEIQQTAVRLGIPDHPFVARRIARAYNLVETNKVNEVSHEEGLYRVHSQCDDKIYTVEVNHGNPSCSCPDGKKTVYCKHMIASLLTAFEQEQKAPVLTVKETAHKENVKASWVVTDGNEYTNVWQDLNGKICCVCGAYYKRDCIHKQAIRDYNDGAHRRSLSASPCVSSNGSKRIENDCGTSEAKELQDKLNGNNRTEDTQSPIHTLDTSDPFQECEQLDIDQIEGRSWRVRSHALGDFVHVLSNGEYVISYRGIMKLAEQHGVTFEASRHDETRTVIAYGRCGNNTRISGKPLNGSSTTAVELAKRNTARQLLPYAEIKALEYKAKLEGDFDWQKAKTACLEIVPDFTLDILINDMVRDGTLRQAHPSDYSRKEWRLIFDACKRDAETNGNDDDGGDDTPSSDDEQPIAVCCICGRTLTNKLSISRCVGPECFKKVGAQGAQFLRDDLSACDAQAGEVSDELIKASKLYQDEALQKRILRACLTLDAPPPVKVLNWLGNEYFGYRNRAILYYVCTDGQLNRIDTHRRKLRHVIVTSETAETELDAHALAQWSTQAKPSSRVSPAVDVAEPSERKAEVPDNVDEFVARCKEMESAVLESHASAKPTALRSTANSGKLPRAEVDDPAPMVEVSRACDRTRLNGDGKRKLQMGKDKNIVLIEPDGTQTPITMRDAAFTYGSNFILRLTTGIACGGDISTVELD